MDGWKKTTNITYICRSPKWGFGWIYKSNRPLIIQQTEFGKHLCTSAVWVLKGFRHCPETRWHVMTHEALSYYEKEIICTAAKPCYVGLNVYVK